MLKLGKQLGWLSIWSVISLNLIYSQDSFFLMNPRTVFSNLPYLGSFIYSKRFKIIGKCIRLTLLKVTPYRDKFFRGWDLIKSFNNNMEKVFKFV